MRRAQDIPCPDGKAEGQMESLGGSLVTSLRGSAGRLEFDDVSRMGQGDFARAVSAGLSSTAKWLPARYLYDDIGAALYGAIVLLPEYYLTAAETEILKRYAAQIVELAGAWEIAELGPGDGAKTRVILERALRVYPRVTYRPIDISRDALQSLSQRLVAEYERLNVSACSGDYVSVLQDRLPRGDAPMLLLFLGSSIGNYGRLEALDLMRAIRSALRPGDSVLLGTDMKKDAAALELAYDDPGGVTAAFNRNVLVRINRELGGTFDLDAFRFGARYDEGRGCVESFQESLVDQTVRIAKIGLDVHFAKGERLLTEASYKYDEEDLSALAQSGGLSVSAKWTDAAGRFLVSLLAVR